MRWEVALSRKDNLRFAIGGNGKYNTAVDREL